MRSKKISIRGGLVCDMIHDIMGTSLGKPIKTGGFRKNPVEPAWACPSGYEYKIIENDPLKMEYLKPGGVVARRVVLQLHGGGYIGPTKSIYRKFAMRYSRLNFGGDVLTIDYRMTPEDPYPAVLENAIHAYQWLIKEKHHRPGQIVVTGDSAGGGLAFALCLYLRDRGLPQPVGLVLMSPWADVTYSGDSYEFNFQRDPLFGNTRESMLYNSSYVGDADSKDPYPSPVFGDFRGLPAMLFQAGSFGALLSDTLSVAEKAKEAGVRRRVSVYGGVFHALQISMDLIPENRKAWDEVTRFMQIVFRIGRKPEDRAVRKVKGTNRTKNEK